jgi:hypothetical protein
MAAKNGTASGVLTRAISRRSAHWSSAARTNPVPIRCLRRSGRTITSHRLAWSAPSSRTRATPINVPSGSRAASQVQLRESASSRHGSRSGHSAQAYAPFTSAGDRDALVSIRTSTPLFNVGSSTLLDRGVVPRRRTDVHLAWPSDLRLAERHHLPPLRDPARQPADREAVREHVLREADGAVDES